MFFGRSLKYVIILQEVKSGSRVEVPSKLQKNFVECYERNEKIWISFQSILESFRCTNWSSSSLRSYVVTLLSNSFLFSSSNSMHFQ